MQWLSSGCLAPVEPMGKRTEQEQSGVWGAQGMRKGRAPREDSQPQYSHSIL